MEVCCISCGVNYKELDADIISYMTKTNDVMGWCEKCIRENLEYLKSNDKIKFIQTDVDGQQGRTFLGTDTKSTKLDAERSKREDTFIYRPENYPGPIAIDCKPTKECDEYHKNAKVQINIKSDAVL